MKRTRRAGTTALVAGLMLTVGLLPMVDGAVGGAAEAPVLPPGAEEMIAAATTQADLTGFADGLAPGEGLGTQLLRAAARDAGVQASYELPALTFRDALVALQGAAGTPVAVPGTHLPVPLADALAPVLTATATAALLADEAFADLSAEERAFLERHIGLAAGAPPTAHADDLAAIERFETLAQRVDLESITLGATIMADALGGFEVPEGVTMQTSWTSPNGLVEVGGMGDDAYTTERVLIVDLGGNDVYDNHAASYAPGSPLPVPVSAVLDLGGNDVYTTTQLHGSSEEASWSQATGMSGIGMLVDRWGDDTYRVSLRDVGTCSEDFWEGQRQLAYGQGIGTLGVGALFDLGGNDVYTVLNADLRQNGCHFGFVYTFAQGVGLFGGLGVLIDDTGDDTYRAAGEGSGRQDNIVHTHAQAAAAGGIGVLVDKEGHDDYEADAYAHVGSVLSYRKGNFAYVFAQGSVLATRLNPALIPTTIKVAGLEETCVTTPLGFFVCVGGGGGSITPCGLLSDAGPVAANGPCDTPSAALLGDLGGSDTFLITPRSSHRGTFCTWANWAVGSGQGSAAFPGLAALVNIDIGTEDAFSIAPEADGSYCSVLNVRAHAYGQGYGGPLMWDHWDRPSTESDGLGVGVLLSPGTVAPHKCMLSETEQELPNDILVRVGCGDEDPGQPCDPITDGIGVGDGVFEVSVHQIVACLHQATDPPPEQMLLGPDRYESDVYAVNGPCSSSACTSIAESRVQGASAREVTAAQGLSYRLLGAGLHIDTSGDDAFRSQARASSSVRSQGTPFSLAQGASTGGIGALVNVGGDDTYESYALRYTSQMPSQIISQAEATPTALLGGICTPALPNFNGYCVGPQAPLRPAGILVDVFGNDWYSQQQVFGGCPGNGALLAPWTWGDSQGISCPPAPFSVISTTVLELGVDWASEVSA